MWVTDLFWVGIKNGVEAAVTAFKIGRWIHRKVTGKRVQCAICGLTIEDSATEIESGVFIGAECWGVFQAAVTNYLQRRNSLQGRMISVNASNQEEFVREFLSYAWHTQWGREDIFFVDLKSKGRAAFGLPPFERGVLIDGGFDRGGLVFNFPVIDGRDEKTGEVSSVKSYDLSAKRYQSINSLNSTIYNDARELSEYQGTSPKGYGGIPIDPSEIKSRILLVVVPLLGATDDQLNYLYTVASTNPNPFDFPKKRSVDIMIFVVD